MEFLLQLFAELIQADEKENIVNTNDELELVEVEEAESIENIFGMMHFH